MNREKLEESVNNSNSLRGVGRILDCCPKTAKVWIKKYNINTDHFVKHKKGYSKYSAKIGEKINFLTILDIYKVRRKNAKNYQYYYLCKCDCGNEKNIEAKSVFSGIVKSCGCLHIKAASELGKKKGSQKNGWKGYEDISGQYWRSVIRGAKSRNIYFNITKEYVWEVYLKQDKKCYFTGRDITFCKDINKTASIDRIDSSKGYIDGNIQIVHKHINILKGSRSNSEFISLCKIVNYYDK